MGGRNSADTCHFFLELFMLSTYLVTCAGAFPWLPPFCASTCAAAARSAMAGEEVHFSTNAGDFSVELYPSYAPRTCKNFSELCARALRPAACRLCPAATVLTE